RTLYLPGSRHYLIFVPKIIYIHTRRRTRTRARVGVCAGVCAYRGVHFFIYGTATFQRPVLFVFNTLACPKVGDSRDSPKPDLPGFLNENKGLRSPGLGRRLTRSCPKGCLAGGGFAHTRAEARAGTLHEKQT